MPKVSVIIPNYNHAKFLDQRIESVIHQTYQDFEIIFLDDASTDNSQEVFAKYADHPKISHIVFNETNSGSPFKQWNTGINLAQGKYIWIAESDDYAELDFLEKLVPVLNANPSIGIAYCESIGVNDKGEKQEKLSSTFWQPARWKNDFTNSGLIECRQYLCIENTIPNASAILFRARLYDDKIKIANENFQCAGDYFTWASILLSPSDIYFLARNMNYFRQHNSNTSREISSLSLIVREALVTFSLIKKCVCISEETKNKAFKKMILSWWFLYLWNQKVLIKNELLTYEKILNAFPEYRFLFTLHFKLLTLPLVKMRYNLGIGTKLRLLKEYFYAS